MMPHTASDAATRLKPRGSSQGGLRQYNERVVLQAVRLNGALPGAEIARLTHLTAQTISLITKRLLDDGLLLKQAPQRGKVGQPSVPLALNPDGAHAIGIKVGRRSLDVLLVDFTGAVRQRWQLDYDFPAPDQVLATIADRLLDIQARFECGSSEPPPPAGPISSSPPLPWWLPRTRVPPPDHLPPVAEPSLPPAWALSGKPLPRVSWAAIWPPKNVSFAAIGGTERRASSMARRSGPDSQPAKTRRARARSKLQGERREEVFMDQVADDVRAG